MKEIVPKSNNKINGILPLLRKQTNKSSSKTAKFWPNLRKTNKQSWHVQFETKINTGSINSSHKTMLYKTRERERDLQRRSGGGGRAEVWSAALAGCSGAGTGELAPEEG